MNPSDKDIIIIDGLIATDQFEGEERAKLTEIRDKPGDNVSAKDAMTIGNLVRTKLRGKKPTG